MGERVLGGAWLRVRMVDTASPPRHQADVFVGYDRKHREGVLDPACKTWRSVRGT
jgi:hypothetical protein